jgi:hypothetical protein
MLGVGDEETVPDDEAACGSACKLPVDFGEVDEYFLDDTSIFRLYVAGCIIFLLILLLNYVTWRHYAPGLSSVLNEPVKESGQSSPRRSMPPN